MLGFLLLGDTARDLDAVLHCLVPFNPRLNTPFVMPRLHVADGLLITHFPYGPTAYFGLMNTVLRHDLENRSTVSEQYPHLIFHNFKTPLGERVCRARSILGVQLSIFSLGVRVCPVSQHIEVPVPSTQARQYACDDVLQPKRLHIFPVCWREGQVRQEGPSIEVRWGEAE